MAAARPTIVFFAGAFADPSCFDALAALFKDEGYHTAYAQVLSLNPANPEEVTTAKDAEHTRKQVLLPLLEDGEDVIVFTHSYGGVVGGAAAAGLSKSSRTAEGKKGGVIGLLYLAGNIVHEGKTLFEAVGGAYPPFIKENTVSGNNPYMPNEADQSPRSLARD
jgi:pimeloyl-ACP methyl ester carboxylesterase